MWAHASRNIGARWIGFYVSFHTTLAAIDRYLAVAASCAKFEECHQARSYAQVDWVALIALANRYLVAPALWTALVQGDPQQRVPADVRSYLALLHNRNADRNARIRQQCLEIGAILMRGGIRGVLLKGAAWLFDGSLAPPFDRMMRDIDLLIASDQIEAAVATLVSAGYRDTCDSLVEKGHFHHAPLLPRRGEAIVEIHRDLAHRVNLLPSDEVIASASEVAPGLLLPIVRHRIAHNVIHAQIENGDFVGGTLNLRDALDLARLVVRSGPEFDWEIFANEARDRDFFRPLSGAIHATHWVLNAPLPIPLESLPGRIHAWRCARQRQWPVANRISENLGRLNRALAWDRDAYPLRLGTDRSLRAQLLVNRRRAQRARAAVGQFRFEAPKFLKGGKQKNVIETLNDRTSWSSSALHRRARRALDRQLAYQRAKAQKAVGHEEEYITAMRGRSVHVRGLLEEMGAMNEGARVLEVGSGAHGLIFYFGTTRGIGVDPLATYYATLFPAWQRRVQTVAAYGERLPFADKTFDFVLCDNVVDHAEFPARIVSEIARVLVPGGLLYFTVNFHHVLYSVAAYLHSAWNAAGFNFEIGPFADHTTHFTLRGARRLFDGLPLRVLKDRANVAEAKALARRCSPRHAGDRLKRVFFKNALYEVVAVRDRVLGRKLAVPVSERTPVLLDWPASNNYGWGIVGLNTFIAWANDRDLQPLMGIPITGLNLDGYAPEQVLALEKAIAESNRLQPNLARFGMRIEMPIVKAMGNALEDPGGAIGTPNIGRCVFENTQINKLDKKLANCDLLLCASRWNADLLRAKTHKRIEVIHEGIDHTLFRPGPRRGLLDQSKFHIFSGGKVEYRKGHDLVLLAFKEFSRRHDDAVLVTAWHSPWPQISVGFKGKLNAALELATDGTIDVKKWVASNGINPAKVIEIKQIPNQLMPGVLRDMDCAVFPSRAEAATNLPAKEAMACGVPVILAANTGMRDIIDGGNCVALAKQETIHDCGTEQWGESDVEEIVQALERLYADSSYRHKIGHEGARWILASGRTWESFARQLKSLIMSL
jgi:glycosyltransferase involved in cell wall biosynthesis/SAM-dependent methyltransferase